ncbi:hypothetical protein OG875_25380 [Streptomyces sp. NBC_01498]|uniref:hypothetical protein n=1 Tax=Streptomyces sp. NBC_01498 TaxID=2975870 RepID=UPI002E7BBDB4|nr:hypothetical protein [Streptomyces sp. NBC_01498]WTL27607.1 hypothetical protein OG875_25380 [Streptomyces sp. NBC_01498]
MAYFIGFFFLAGSGFMTWRVAQLWRDPGLVGHFVDTFAFLPFGAEVKRGEVRSLALTTASLWGITALFLIGATDVGLDGPVGVGFAVALLVVLLCLLAEVGVVLFNAPKFVVPPHMRADPGLLAARRARRTAGPRRLEP